MRWMTLAAIGLLACGVGGGAGCTQVTRTFPGEPPDQVWRALVAVAQTPDYTDPDPTKRWTVKENQVWVDAEGGRIEIYRELDRILHRASTEPLREHRTWRFQVRLEPTDPPRATFLSRGFGIPMKATDEAERYFADVHELIEFGGPEPEAASPVAAPPAAPAEPAAPPEEPFIDVEKLEPRK